MFESYYFEDHGTTPSVNLNIRRYYVPSEQIFTVFVKKYKLEQQILSNVEPWYN